jgi:hypothetical protein
MTCMEDYMSIYLIAIQLLNRNKNIKYICILFEYYIRELEGRMDIHS